MADKLQILIQSKSYGLKESVASEISAERQKKHQIDVKLNAVFTKDFQKALQSYQKALEKAFKIPTPNTSGWERGAKKQQQVAQQHYQTIKKFYDFKDIESKANASLSRLEQRLAKLKNPTNEVAHSVYNLRNQLTSISQIKDSDKHYTYYKKLQTEIRNTNTEVMRLLESQRRLDAESFKLDALKARFNEMLSKNPLLRTNVNTMRTVSAIESMFKNSEVDANHLQQVSTMMTTLTRQAQAFNAAGVTPLQQIMGNIGKFSQWLTMTTGIMAVMRLLRDVVVSVRDVDKAMVNLRKVTEETDATYKNFLHNASQDAKALGITISDLVESTASFAKLGYNLKDSQELGKVASVYANVGDLDVNTASEHLVSTLKAFKIEGKEAIKVVDKLNEVGNKYSVSSAGLGESLKRSSVALKNANNSLDESIALLTAANEIVQDPEVVGTAFKTLSMRIRGVAGLTKKEFEELGDDAEGMEKTITKVQSKIYQLTNRKVDIMIDESTFKSTYQILKEISAVWDELSDINQAALLEVLGGKRQGQIVGATIENFSQAEKALATSLSSAGSAMKEHERWMEGIEGKTNRLKASWQELSLVSLNSNAFKGFVDVLNDIVNLMTKLGGLVPVTTILIAGFIGKTISLTKSLAFAQMLGNALPAFGMFRSALQVAITTMGATEAVAISLSSALSFMIPVAAIFAGIAVFRHFHQTAQENFNTVQDMQGEYGKLQEEIKELTSQVGHLGSEIDRLKSKGKLSITDEQELAKLEAQNKALSNRLSIKLALQEVSEKNISDESFKALQNRDYKRSEVINDYGGSGLGGGDLGRRTKVSAYEYLDTTIQEVARLKQEILELEKAQVGLDASSSVFKKNSEDLEKAYSTLEKYTSGILETIDFYDSLAANITKPTEEQQKLIDSFEQLKNKFLETEGYDLTNIANSTDMVNAKLEEVEKSYSVVEQAIASYDAQGQLSADTIITLTGMYPELAEVLLQEGDVRQFLMNKLSEENEHRKQIYNEQLSMSEQLYNTILSQNSMWVAQMAQQYNVDFTNFKNLILAKQALLKQLSAQAAVSNMQKDLRDPRKGLTNFYMNKDAIAQRQADWKKQLGDIQAQVDRDFAPIEAQFKTMQASSGKVGSGRIGGGGDRSKDKKGRKGGGGKKGKGSKGKEEDKWKQAFDEAYDELKYLREKDEISETEYRDKLDALNQKYFANKKKYLKEYRQYDLEIYKLSKQLSQDKIKDIEFDIDRSKREENTQRVVELYRQAIAEVEQLYAEGLKRGIDKNDDAMQNLERSIWKYKDAVEQVYTEVQKSATDIAMDAMRKRADELVAELDNRIDEIKEREQSSNSYYEERINALQKEKGELSKQREEQNELKRLEEARLKIEEARKRLQEAQANKTRRVFDRNLGFVYKTDPKAIEDAEKNLRSAEQSMEDLLLGKAEKDKGKEIDEQIELIRKEKEERSKSTKLAIEGLEREKKAIREKQKWIEDDIKNQEKQKKVEKELQDIQDKGWKANVQNAKDFENQVDKLSIALHSLPKETNVKIVSEYVTKNLGFEESSVKNTFDNASKNKKQQNTTQANTKQTNLPQKPAHITQAKWDERLRVERAIERYRQEGDKHKLEQAYKYKQKLIAQGGYYAKGGVVDYTGMAMVHGSTHSAETVFNARDSKKLYDFIHNSENISSLLAKRISQQTSHVFKTDSNNNAVELSIGDIHVHGVQNADGLANDIVNKLPAIVIQKINKR